MRTQAIPVTRRQLLRTAAVATVAVIPAMGAEEVGATWKWCRVDPTVRINGQIVHLRLAAHVRNRRMARRQSNGKIGVVIRVPEGVEFTYLAEDNGFGDGYDAKMESSPDLVATEFEIPVQVSVIVPMNDEAIRIRASFKPANPGLLVEQEAEGTVNSWLALTPCDDVI
jgi:hypothetical protein